ncbi:orotidine-5'-phosphate decarboxylase [Lentisphaera profundi]|uniref:Orotidine 5'-phosphate decarboxylase n=1 Tax=Lentisphaera profundi TaxID=1658616 RepID=A0ABY7VXD5_9BACT|nr:orotidine-5'-phosphate decarboxylase [Lentisphaera profundi]WDE96733.1 orotidine-5'-phosphate decarboxylase [Lentisphaera profundi]
MTKLIVALDVDSLTEAEEAVDKLGGKVTWFKVGKQLFTAEGPAIVKMLKNRGFKVFLDLKFHDIPNTVAQAVKSALSIGADMVNFHATGGSEMMRVAVEKNRPNFPDAELIAVTVLTSSGQSVLDELHLSGTPEEAVLRFAGLAKNAGVDGVVCSAWEIEALKKAYGTEFKVVVPGIRPKGSASDDQKRIMTPRQAAELGADYIVVGRPIMKASDPIASVEAILAELQL